MLNAGLEWQELANCLGSPLDLFFPDSHEKTKLAKAKTICAGCQVKTECLEYALSFTDRALPGVWGGTTENQRKAMHDYATPIG